MRGISGHPFAVIHNPLVGNWDAKGEVVKIIIVTLIPRIPMEPKKNKIKDMRGNMKRITIVLLGIFILVGCNFPTTPATPEATATPQIVSPTPDIQATLQQAIEATAYWAQWETFVAPTTTSSPTGNISPSVQATAVPTKITGTIAIAEGHLNVSGKVEGTGLAIMQVIVNGNIVNSTILGSGEFNTGDFIYLPGDFVEVKINEGRVASATGEGNTSFQAIVP